MADANSSRPNLGDVANFVKENKPSIKLYATDPNVVHIEKFIYWFASEVENSNSSYRLTIEKIRDTVAWFEQMEASDKNAIDARFRKDEYGNSISKTKNFLENLVIDPLLAKIPDDLKINWEELEKQRDKCVATSGQIEDVKVKVEDSYKITCDKLHQYFTKLVEEINRRYMHLEQQASDVKDAKIARLDSLKTYLDALVYVDSAVLQYKDDVNPDKFDSEELRFGLKALIDSGGEITEDDTFGLTFNQEEDMLYVSSIGYMEAPDGPGIKEIVPNHGPCVGGSEIVILGKGFGNVEEKIQVVINEEPCTNVELVQLDCKIRCVTPPGCGLKNDVQIIVIPEQVVEGVTKARVSSKFMSVADAKTCFHYDAPFISAMSANSSSTSGGGIIEIVGDNLGLKSPSSPAAATVVKIGGRPCEKVEVVEDNTKIRFTVPEGFGKNHLVNVFVKGQKSKAAEHLLFSYEAPEIHGLDPTEGPTDGNTRMTLEGANFGPEGSVIEVSIGGEPCTDLILEKPHCTISCTIPYLATMSIIQGLPVVVTVASNDSKQQVVYDAVDMDQVKEAISELDAKGYHNSAEGKINWEMVHDRLAKKMKAIQAWESYHQKPFAVKEIEESANRLSAASLGGMMAKSSGESVVGPPQQTVNKGKI